MKRITVLSLLFAGGLLATSTPASAQTADASSWFMGKINLLLLGRDDVASSKFEEYREVPKGMSMPAFTLQGDQKGTDFALFGQNVSRTDQRYTGWVKTDWIGVAFDYNQIPHNMGNDGRSILTETAPGVWSMSSTLRAALGNAVESTSSSARTYDFYANLFAPTIASASVVDVSGLRQRGNVEFDLGRKLPFELKATYLRDVKTGYRGNGGGRIDGTVSTIMEVPWPLNEVTQDIGFRAAVNNKTWGNVYAAYAHNWYNNRQETTLVDYPYQAVDKAYVSSVGGPATARMINPPDNSADRTSFGVLLKFAKQTRLTADLAFGQWLQNAPLYPYTSNSTILNAVGVPANTLAALDVQSAHGKIDTRMLNFGFSSRPAEGLGLRLRYRTYNTDNKTATFVRTGSTGNNPDRSWAAASSPTPEEPFGYATANPYGTKTGRFDAQVSYDIQDLTLEATYRNAQIDRTYREATQGSENGWSIAAILHSGTRMLFRGVYDGNTRKASGYDAASIAATAGLASDESERDSSHVGFDISLMPNDKATITLAYFRNKDDYPNQPDRVAGVAGTANGLLGAKYDTFTIEADLTPNDRAGFGAYYTYEKNLSTTASICSATSTSCNVTGLLTFDGSDKGNTFGLNGHFVMVPDKWMFDFNARRQKVDGLMAITGDPAGSFALARAAYGGIQDITDYNDTDLTTVVAQVDYSFAKALGLSFGYAYEKYTFADAYSTVNNEVFPASGGFYLKTNDGSYKANVVYTKLTYHW